MTLKNQPFESMYLLFQHGDFPIRQPESLERGNPNLMVVSFLNEWAPRSD